MRQKLRQKWYLHSSRTISTAACQKHRVKTSESSKTQKSDGSKWWVIILLQMMCNKNKNSTWLIDGSQGFARCAQILLATKIGGATAIQKLWVKWTLGSLGTVGTSIVLVHVVKHFIQFIKMRFARVSSDDHQYICLLWPQILALKLTGTGYPNSRLYGLSDRTTC